MVDKRSKSRCGSISKLEKSNGLGRQTVECCSMSSQQRVLRELDSLRSMLDGSPVRSPSHMAPPAYSLALNSAERSVDRLGKSIEAAEEEMEMALRRTTGAAGSAWRRMAAHAAAVGSLTLSSAC